MHRSAFSPAATARQRRMPDGFTLIELMVVIAILAVLAGFAVSYLHSTRQQALAITAHHDLKNFVQAQESHFAAYDRFKGASGQTLRSDPAASDFTLDNFRISAGVVITVVSGDPEDPYDDGSPFVVEATHTGAPTVFEYNFATGAFTER